MSELLLYSAEAERAVLGCMIAQPGDVIHDAAGALLKEDFFVPAHQEIFAAVRDMAIAHRPVDTIGVHQWLTDRKLAEAVGSPGILAELLVGFANHLNVGSYIRIVKEKSLLRALQSACSAIVQDIAEMPDSVASVLDRAEASICRVTNLHVTGSQMDAHECVTRFLDLREKIQIGEVETRIKTGLSCLDDDNGGLPTPSYVILAGEQGAGKSALMLNILRHCCANNIGVGGFSLEMTVEQIIQRLIAERLSMDGRRMNMKLSEREHEAIRQEAEKIRSWQFIIDPTSGLRPSDIRSGTRRMVRAGCKVIWLDNAQLAAGTNDRDKRVDQLTELSRMNQQLYKEHDILFIMLTQVTRNSQKSKAHFTPADLADCAAFERDARVIVFIENDHESEGSSPFCTPVFFNVAKYSEGSTGCFRGTFNKVYQRIQSNPKI